MLYSDAFSFYTRKLSAPCFSPLSAAEERELILQYSETRSQELFTKLTNSYLRFVLYVLKSFKIPDSVDIMDIVQEGNIGLMESITRFNPQKYQCRITTYSIFWIRLYISAALSQHQKLTSVFSALPEDSDPKVPVSGVDEFGVDEVSADIVKYILPVLDGREKSVIVQFFGLLPPYQPKTLQEIGSMLHIHLERVRQIKDAALQKLKKSDIALIAR